MTKIATFLEYLRESAGELTVRKESLGDNNFEWTWQLGGRSVGEMMTHVDEEKGVASIVSFMKRSDAPRGVGYRFIRMCIDELLDSGLAVVQADHTSNHNSQAVWQKLAGEPEYIVEPTTWRGDPAKMVRKRK